MEIRLKTKDEDLLLRREELVGGRDGVEAFQETQTSIEHEQIGLITDSQLTTGNFLIAHCQFELVQPIQLIKDVEEEVIQLDFVLRGDSQALTSVKASSQCFSAGQHNICYIPRSESSYEYYTTDLPHDFSVVIMPKDIYFRLLPPGSALHRQFVKQISQQKAAFMTAKNPPITAAMDWLIRDVRTSQRTGSLKRLFIESRITELLLLQLEQMQVIPSAVLPTKRADRGKLHEARELLDAHYPASPTIVELAKLVGLNEFTLKRGFKAQFGTTILGYVTQRRMDDARRFLLESEKSISEISYWVGYKNPAHFTVAFKQYFGVLPSSIRMSADGAGDCR